MPRSLFSRELHLAASPEQCWDVLVDVPLLVSWISVLETAQEHVPLERYSAVLADRLGPFTLRADLGITLSGVKPARHVEVAASGEDRQVRSRLVIGAVLQLEPVAAERTLLRVEGSYEVTGKVAAIGGATIRKKADGILGEFFDRLAARLGAA